MALVTQHGSPLMMVAIARARLPRLALGLSGFETGVAVMPLVKGAPGTRHGTRGRIRNTRKLLTSAAAIMSVFLITSSFVTTLLIPPAEVREAARPPARPGLSGARFFGDAFGTVYDISARS